MVQTQNIHPFFSFYYREHLISIDRDQFLALTERN